MARQAKVDVVTIGAGWTAAILAWQLTEAGLRVVSLEQGPTRWTTPDFDHNHDGLRYTIRKAMMHNLRHESWTWRPNPRLPSLPMRQYGAFHPGQGLGGAGVHWAGQTWRFYPSDHDYRSHHVARYGEAKLPEGNRIQDWPVRYQELEPFYDQMEYDIGIVGRAGNIRGELTGEGNPFEGYRSRQYPLPPLVPSIPAQMFSQACREHGLHPFRQPGGILSQAYAGLSRKPRSGCLYCGFCVRYGCEVDAKASPLTDHIPLALATGLYDVRTHCYVLHINVGRDGLATGVTYQDLLTGEEHEQPADIVIVSGYTMSNTRLLLLSRSPAHPDGIGNDRGMVGKNLTYQLIQTPVTGIFEDRRFNLFTGNSLLQDVMHDYNADNFDHSNLEFIGGASIACGGGERQPLASAADMPALDAEGEQGDDNGDDENGDNGNGNGDNDNGNGDDENGNGDDENGDNGNGDGRPLIAGEVGSLVGNSTEWGMQWKENLRRNWDGFFGIGIQGESLPYEDQFMDLDPNYRDAWGRPLLRLTYDFHENDYRLYRFLAARCIEIMRAMNPTRMVYQSELEPFEIQPYQSTHITGGCIMGSDPTNSVTNKYGQVWDTPNVFVTGAALYPQNPGMNPTGPLIALSYFTGHFMRRIYLRNPERLMEE
jgi:gluconate 2-dehydrogenase alpha chain